MGAARRDVARIGYFGSYARGNWGVGSDVDLIIVVDSSDEPPERRGVHWDATALPVPADVLVYTATEWAALSQGGRFGQTVGRETVWVYSREEAAAGAPQEGGSDVSP
jgi:hypothetical protein